MNEPTRFYAVLTGLPGHGLAGRVTKVRPVQSGLVDVIGPFDTAEDAEQALLGMLGPCRRIAGEYTPSMFVYVRAVCDQSLRTTCSLTTTSLPSMD